MDSENIPILSKLVNYVTGVSIFHSEVYFINKTVQMAVKWGTDSMVRFVEPTLGVPIELGASGEMNISVLDGRKMLIKLVGTMKGISWGENSVGFTKSLQASFRPLIATTVKANLASIIKQQNIDIVEIDEHLQELSDILKEKIVAGFEDYGLTVQQFYVTNILLPEKDPNFRKIKELHTATLQKRSAAIESDIRASQAESRAAYLSAEAEAEAKVRAAQRLAVLEGQTTETEVAKREAERRLIQAQAEAQATQMAGIAEAQVMQAKGYNQKDVLQAEVQKAYAEGIGNMGAGVSVGGGSVIGDMLGLGVGMAAMGSIAPQVGNMLKDFNVESQANMSQDEKLPKMECPSCGKIIPSDAKFCLECGVKIDRIHSNEMICPMCRKRTPKGKFCVECGHHIISKCSNCGTDIPLGGKFCLECGAKLE